jgi:hypothetical protein
MKLAEFVGHLDGTDGLDLEFTVSGRRISSRAATSRSTPGIWWWIPTLAAPGAAPTPIAPARSSLMHAPGS